MLHLLKYCFLQTIRERAMMFWALLFPLILAMFFYISIWQMGSEENQMDVIPVAVVEEQEDVNFQTFLEEMSEEWLDIREMEESDAEEALEKGEVKGIFYVGNDRRMKVSSSGYDENILETLLASYDKNETVLRDIMEHHPERIEDAIASISTYKSMVKNTTLGGRTTNNFIEYFFALIAMACLYGAFLGLFTTSQIQANTSALGARRSVAPTPKLKQILCNFIVLAAVHFVDVTVLVVYLTQILGIDLGTNIAGIMLVVFLGSLIGVCLGILIASIGKAGEGVKIGILVGVTMFCSFLAGLMASNIKNCIELYCPILNRINPAAVISDAFYCLSVYDNPQRYSRDLLTLAVMCVMCIGLSYLAVRRERYDSI